MSDLVWRTALLSVVFLADIVVFAGLCREELRHWRAKGTARVSTLAAPPANLRA